MDEWDEGVEIDWESPFNEIRSSEVDSIVLEFLDNGRLVVKEDDKGEEYSQYNFNCIRQDMANPKEMKYITSSKRLIEQFINFAPIEGKTLKITKSGSGFQTRYTVTEE